MPEKIGFDDVDVARNGAYVKMYVAAEGNNFKRIPKSSFPLPVPFAQVPRSIAERPNIHQNLLHRFMASLGFARKFYFQKRPYLATFIKMLAPSDPNGKKKRT